jgi:hypothetical protein
LAVADCLDSFSTPSARPLSPSHAKDVSAETSSLRDQAIETERRKLMQVNGLLHCLSEILLQLPGEAPTVAA